MFAIYKREMRSYFTTPIGYVFLAVFAAVSATFFAHYTYMAEKADLSGYFRTMVTAYVLMIPVLTMKCFADELKGKTDQLLLTAPVSITGVVFAKFFAALCTYMAGVLISMINFIFLAVNNYKVQTGIAVGMFLGMILVGAACIAVGIFISAMTESQLVAALLSLVVLAVMQFTDVFNNAIPFAWLRTVLSNISIGSRYALLADGRFDFSAILYYLSIAGVFILLTIRVFERKRWH